MADSNIRVPTDGTGKFVDAESFTRGLDTIQRQRVRIGGAADLDLAVVSATAGLDTNPTDRALRDCGKVDIAAFDVSLPTGANNIGDVDVLTLPSLVAGGAKIGAVDLDSDATIAAAVPTVGQFVAGTDGTNARALKTDTAGELQIDVLTLPALVAGVANIGDVDVLSMPTGASAAQAQGDVANDGVDSGNPVKVGGLASGAVPVAVAAADRVNAYHDREGRQIIRPWSAGDWTQVNFPAANTRASSTKAAGVAGVRHVCTGITASLAAGATAPGAVQLDIRVRDGILDTGTILWQMAISLPATAGAMNGVTRSGLFIRGTAATAMTIEFSVAGGANTFESVSMEGTDISES